MCRRSGALAGWWARALSVDAHGVVSEKSIKKKWTFSKDWLSRRPDEGWLVKDVELRLVKTTWVNASG